jgi:D-alanine transaminase
MDVAGLEGLEVEERPFTREEALKAKEAFVTSATNLVMPVTFVDGLPIGDGRSGPLARRLRLRFHQLAEISPA